MLRVRGAHCFLGWGEAPSVACHAPHPRALRFGALLCLWFLANACWRAAESPLGERFDPWLLSAPPRIHAQWVSEPLAAARLIFLGLHAGDSHRGKSVPFADMDVAAIIAWMRLASELDPHSEYALPLAALAYLHTPDEAAQRRLVGFVAELYLRHPARRAPWLRWVAWQARHRLRDAGLADRLRGLAVQAIDEGGIIKNRALDAASLSESG